MTARVARTNQRTQALPMPWEIWVAAFLSLVLLYFLQSESGAVLSQHWGLLHEVVHDGRHMLAVPCH